MRTSEIITLCYLRSQGIELLCRRLGSSARGRQLPFANRVHHFYASNRTARRPKGLEAQRKTRNALTALRSCFTTLLRYRERGTMMAVLRVRL